ncbi:hypothetical protein ACFPYN_05490 [Paenisporosarcina macmurdoensis]|uniref:Uncharacterized protein n=1 Tax=Paenisporosarcina macmurdoensis TaxID=212659 RepID=A0ABW1L6X0_9BACL
MTKNYELNEAQISVLRSLHFWRRNLYVASIHQDLIECTKSKKAIFHVFKSCDRLDIPFAIQNLVIYAASQNIAFGDLKIGG